MNQKKPKLKTLSKKNLIDLLTQMYNFFFFLINKILIFGRLCFWFIYFEFLNI